jgi:hypothetical protein
MSIIPFLFFLFPSISLLSFVLFILSFLFLRYLHRRTPFLIHSSASPANHRRSLHKKGHRRSPSFFLHRGRPSPCASMCRPAPPPSALPPSPTLRQEPMRSSHCRRACRPAWRSWPAWRRPPSMLSSASRRASLPRPWRWPGRSSSAATHARGMAVLVYGPWWHFARYFAELQGHFGTSECWCQTESGGATISGSGTSFLPQRAQILGAPVWEPFF